MDGFVIHYHPILFLENNTAVGTKNLKKTSNLQRLLVSINVV